MNWDLIQDQWQSNSAAATPVDGTKVLSELVRKNSKLHQKVRRRDALETAVALIVAVVFAVSAWFMGTRSMWIASMASVFLALWGLYVPWKLHQQRRLIPDPESSQDVLSYLRAERRALQGQYDLLRSVFRWYLGPAAVGVLTLYAALSGFSQATLIYTLVVVGIYGLIYWANQRVATHQLAPVIRKINQQINELSDAQSADSDSKGGTA